MESFVYLESFQCIQHVSLSLHLPPLLHAVSSQLGLQKAREGFRAAKPRMMRRDPLNWVVSDVLVPVVIGKDNGGNGHGHEIEYPQGFVRTI